MKDVEDSVRDELAFKRIKYTTSNPHINLAARSDNHHNSVRPAISALHHDASRVLLYVLLEYISPLSSARTKLITVLY
jgi:hypothetical protein